MTFNSDDIISRLNADVDRELYAMCSASSATANASTAGALSMEKMQMHVADTTEALNEFARRERKAAEMENFFEGLGVCLKPWQRRLAAQLGSVDIIESVHAVTLVQIRTHKKRRNQSEAYHRRVQKKWRKRFGSKAVRAAYVLDNRIVTPLTRSGHALVCHPQIAAQLRRSIAHGL